MRERHEDKREIIRHTFREDGDVGVVQVVRAASKVMESSTVDLALHIASARGIEMNSVM